MSVSKILNLPIPSLRQFTVTIQNASVTRISGATGGVFVANFIGDDGSTIVSSFTQALTTVASTYYITVTGVTNQRVTNMQFYMMGSAIGNQRLVFKVGNLSVNAWAQSYWQGYIDPSNLERSWINPNYFMNINAVDGLGDLKQIDMVFTGITSGNSVSYLNCIKQAIAQTGINLDFRVQNNIYESNGGPNYNSLLYLINPNARFSKLDNGITTNRSCYDVLTSILSTFNVRLFQSNNYYQILSINEYNSKLKYFKVKDLSSTGQSFYNRAIDISNYRASVDSDTLSKVRPLKTLVYPMTNNYIGSDQLQGKTFSNGVSPNGMFGNFQYDTNANVYTCSTTSFRPDGPNVECYMQSQTFPITYAGAGSGISIPMDITMSGTWTGTTSDYYPPSIRVEVWNNGTGLKINTDVLVGSLGLVSGLQFGVSTKHYGFNFSVGSSFTAYLKIYVVPISKYSGTQTTFANIQVLQTFPTSTIFDQQFTITNALSKAIAVDDKQTLDWYDNTLNTTASVFYNSITPTSSWSNYSGMSRVSLVDIGVQLPQLFGYNKLKSRQKFLDYRIVELKNNTVDMFNSISLNGKVYNINSMANDLMNCKTQMELYENPQTPISGVTFQAFTLDTSNE